MSLYLVRWPWLTASVVSARNEDDLRDILDEVADIEGVTWSVYRGPLWVDFHVPAKVRIEEKKKGVPLRPDEIVIDDLKALEAGKFELDMPEYSEHTAEMCELITKKAFPNLHKVLFGDNDDVILADNLSLVLILEAPCESKKTSGPEKSPFRGSQAREVSN